MRLCFLSRRFFPAISGMSVYAANLLRELVLAGHQVTLVSQYRDDAFGRGVYGGGPPPSVPGVRVIGLAQHGEQAGGDFERDIAEMVATIAAEHARTPFDLIHAQYGYPTGWAALLATHDLGVPNVVSIQGGDGHWVGSCCETHRLAMVRVLDHAGAVLIGCRSFAEEVTQRLGTDPGRFTIIPGAVDTARFTPGGAAPADGQATFLYHGRIDARKGVLDLIEAAAVLAASGLPFALIVSGVGPDSEVVARRVASLGLSGRVTLSGPVAYEDAPDVYRRAQVFVSPTYAEGFSNTLLEAMASGLAVISCRAVGVVDCLRNGENGILTEPGDVPALAAAMQRLIVDRSLRVHLAAAALAECRRRYAWRGVASQILAVYAATTSRPVDRAFDTVLPHDAACRFRASPHLL